MFSKISNFFGLDRNLFKACNYIAFFFTFFVVLSNKMPQGIQIFPDDILSSFPKSFVAHFVIYLIYLAFSFVLFLLCNALCSSVELAYKRLTGKTINIRLSKKPKTRLAEVLSNILTILIWGVVSSKFIMDLNNGFSWDSQIKWMAISAAFLVAAWGYSEVVLIVFDKISAMFKRTKAVAA